VHRAEGRWLNSTSAAEKQMGQMLAGVHSPRVVRSMLMSSGLRSGKSRSDANQAKGRSRTLLAAPFRVVLANV
jgi:hypothetical protein